MTALQKHLSFYNNDKELIFDEGPHTYTNDQGQLYTSVTQILGQYEEPFNQEYWGMYTALKDSGKAVKPDVKNNAIIVNGKSMSLKSLHKDSIYSHLYNATISKWKATNAESIHRGNNTHDYLERSINKSKGFVSGAGEDNYTIKPKGYKKEAIETVHDLDSTDLKDTYPVIYDRLKMFIERDCVIYAEKRLKLDLARLAGTIDVPILKRGTNKFCILDWKTNKDEFKPTSGYMKKIKVGGVWVKSDQFVPTDDKFKYPLSHIPLCKLNGYYLQLSIYAYMMECWGYELVDKGLEIIHIRPGVEPKLIKVPYLIDDVERIILVRLEELGIPFYNEDYHKAGKLTTI